MFIYEQHFKFCLLFYSNHLLIDDVFMVIAALLKFLD